jgi:hypothetical protein
LPAQECDEQVKTIFVCDFLNTINISLSFSFKCKLQLATPALKFSSISQKFFYHWATQKEIEKFFSSIFYICSKSPLSGSCHAFEFIFIFIYLFLTFFIPIFFLFCLLCYAWINIIEEKKKIWTYVHAQIRRKLNRNRSEKQQKVRLKIYFWLFIVSLLSGSWKVCFSNIKVWEVYNLNQDYFLEWSFW